MKFSWLRYSISKRGGNSYRSNSWKPIKEHQGHCSSHCLNLVIVGNLMMKIRHRNGMPISKHKILQLFIILLLFQFLLFCCCWQTDHAEHTKSKPAKPLTVSRQEKPREWTAVKLVKRESESLTYFPTKPSCYIVDCNLYATTFVQTQCTCKQQQHFVWDERREIAHYIF